MSVTGFLKKVIELKNEEIAEQKLKISLNTLRSDAELMGAGQDFQGALAGSSPDKIGIIAEIKKASPSKGDIKIDLDPTVFAEKYTKGGACAISVLTEKTYFKGSIDDLKKVRKSTFLPILRKDFTISSYQIFEAKTAGADSILLITSILSKQQLSDYITLCREIYLEPLVEINSENEFEKAVLCNAKIIGINNRNLQTLKTDLNVSKRIALLFTPEQIPVEASGIWSRNDIMNGVGTGIYNFLVGESIVRSDDPEEFIRTLTST